MTQPAHPATPADHLNAINAAFAEQEAKLRAQIESSASELNRATQAAAEAQLDASALRQANERHALQLRQLQGELAAAQKALSEERLAEDERVRSLVVRAVANSEANQAGLIKSLELEASQDRQSRERLLQESRERERQLGDEVSRLKSAIADQTHAHREKQADLEHRLLICNEQLTRLDEQAREHQRRRAELEVRLDAAAGERARVVELAAQNEASLSAQLAQAVAALHKQAHEHSATHQALLEAYERSRQAQQARADDATAWLHAREAQHALAAQQLAEVQKDASRQLEVVTAQQHGALQALEREATDNRQLLAGAAEELQNELRRQLYVEKTVQQALNAALTELRGSWSWRLTRPLRVFGSGARRPISDPNLQQLMAPSLDVAGNGSPSKLTPSLSSSRRLPMHHQAPTNQPAQSVEQLLMLNDVDFVNCAYLTILGRRADPSGFEAFLNQVRSGADKEQLIAALATSPEGMQPALSKPHDLEQVLARARRNRPSFMTKVVRRVAMSALRPMSLQILSLNQQLAALAQMSAMRFDEIDAALIEISKMKATSNLEISDSHNDILDGSANTKMIYRQIKEAAKANGSARTR